MKILPNKLRLIDGQIVYPDNDTKAYLEAWAKRNNVDSNTPLIIIKRSDFEFVQQMCCIG